MASFDSGSSLSIQDIEDLYLASNGSISGADTDDREYTSIVEMWNYELADTNNKWYRSAYDYWEDESMCDISDDGVLQGFGALTPADTVGSNAFLDTLQNMIPELQLGVVADCGAGIGRVAKNLLLPRFQCVHLVEQSPRLLAAAPEYVGAEYKDKIVCIVQGLQDFDPAPQTYDVVWIQWVIGHLHDLDFIKFFRKCVQGLKQNGVIVLKDNTSGDQTFMVDKDDSSVSRSRNYIKLLTRLAGLEVIAEEQQAGFPEELFPVYMFAFVPVSANPIGDKEA